MTASLFVVALWVVFGLCAAASAEQAPVRLPVEELTIETEAGPRVFRAEIADTDAERSTGLMFRRTMAEDEAMLFYWPAPTPVSMWMRNTYIPLDMLFVDRTGKVVHIARNTTPHALDLITAGRPVTAVLELLAGTADRHGIDVGDRLIHRLFRAP